MACEGVEELQDLFEQRDDVYSQLERQLNDLPLSYYKKIKIENVLEYNELQYKREVVHRILETLQTPERYLGSADIVASIFTHGKLKLTNAVVFPSALTKNIRLYAAIEDRIRVCSPAEPPPTHRSYAYKVLKTTGFNKDPKESVRFLKNELNVLAGHSEQAYRSQLIIDLLIVLVRHPEEYESNKELLERLLHELPSPQLVEAETFLRAELDRTEEDSNKQNSLRPLLASVLHNQKKYINEAYVLKENYVHRKERLSLSHPSIQNKLKAFIIFLMKTRQYEIAEAFLEKEIAMESDNKPLQMKQYSLLLSLLANVYLIQKKYEKADPILSELFNTYVGSIRKVNKTGEILLKDYPALKELHDVYMDSIKHYKDKEQQRVHALYIAKVLQAPERIMKSTNVPPNIESKLQRAFQSYRPVKPPLTGANANEAAEAAEAATVATVATVAAAEAAAYKQKQQRNASRFRSGPLTTYSSYSRGGGTKKAPSSRRMTKSLCPSGQVLQFGSTRKKGRRSTRKLCGPGIGKLKEGQLAKFGYTVVVHKSAEARRAALDKAVKEFGALSVFRKLNAVYVYTRKSAKESSKIFKEDRDWIKSKYM